LNRTFDLNYPIYSQDKISTCEDSHAFGHMEVCSSHYSGKHLPIDRNKHIRILLKT